MSKYQATKVLVQNFFDAMENASPETVADVLTEFTAEDYLWRGVYPFREQHGADVVAETFWAPLMKSLTRMQRRQDIFIAGVNEINGEQWVMSMGNFMGLFDADWLGIPHTRKIANLRYADFNCVEKGKITQTGLFIDITGLMVQAGVYPLPPSTSVYFNYPGPRTHDGLLFEDAPEEEGVETLALVNEMVDDLIELNESGSMGCSPEVLERTWSKDMIWYGPAGIGASYTIPRYQEQHQLPFRNNLDAVFSEFKLNTSDKVEIPVINDQTATLINLTDPDKSLEIGVSKEIHNYCSLSEDYAKEKGVLCLYTCAPYLSGMIPTFGEHLAWMESSAVVAANSIFGARTNTESIESTGASSLSGRTPYWGLHCPDNRLANYHIQVDAEIIEDRDYGLLGYLIGDLVQENIPVISGLKHRPSFDELKHFGAASAASGGVELYHIVGVTPEAHSLNTVSGGKSFREVIRVIQDDLSISSSL